jgi:phytol kinase
MSTALDYEVPAIGKELRKEVVRKGLHLLIAALPLIAVYSYTAAYTLLIVGSGVYTLAEVTRLIWNGSRSFLPYNIIRTTSIYVSRPGEANGFIIAPLTLAAGAGLTMLIFPPEAMRAGILALAFGDTFAALAGKVFSLRSRKERKGKSAAGTAACFIVSAFCIWLVTKDLAIAAAAGAVAAFAENVTPRELDNMAVPLAAAAVVYLML